MTMGDHYKLSGYARLALPVGCSRTLLTLLPFFHIFPHITEHITMISYARLENPARKSKRRKLFSVHLAVIAGMQQLCQSIEIHENTDYLGRTQYGIYNVTRFRSPATQSASRRRARMRAPDGFSVMRPALLSFTVPLCSQCS